MASLFQNLTNLFSNIDVHNADNRCIVNFKINLTFPVEMFIGFLCC